MAASPHANPALHRSNGGQAFKWLALAAVLLLGVSGIALRSAKRPSIAHRFTKDFYSGIKAEALPVVEGEPRRGRTPVEEQMWLKLHEAYAAEVKQLETTGVDLVFYGDSITEAMRGTTMGLPNDKHSGTPAVVQKHYGHLRTAALSLAGDTTLNLLWRVQHGEGPTFSPKVAVVLIGTNDLTNPLYQLDVTNPEATGAIVAAGATSAVRAMLEQNMRMHVLLLAITPRGERFVFASFADKYKQPSKLSPAIAATNMHLQRFADSNDRVTYVDCNAVLLEEDGAGGMQIAYEFMPDSLHPNALGMDVFLDCLDHHLSPWLPLKSLL
ncbi:g6997 [Coccomyxa viridis]|uniref:G6997 protein n=1 Tax=Coccomyxa viridis TaxID=1274662 RepID=A0ABP1FWR3_9CHLO